MRQFAIVALLVLVALALILAYDAMTIAVHVIVWAVVGYLVLGPAALLGIWWHGRRQQAKIEMLKLQQPQSFHAPAGHSLVVYEPDGARPGTLRNVTLEAFAAVSPDGAPSPAWQMYQAMHGGRNWRVVDTPPLALPEPPAEPILSALRRTQRGLIVGVQDAGKSTLLRYLADDARAISRVAIVDPHTYNGKWPAGCDVIGAGRDFGAIDRALGALLAMMNSRYQRMAQGHSDRCNETPVTVIVDEWLAIARFCPGAREAIVTLLSESRKAAMRVYVACHSDSVKSLGLDGQGDLRDGFEVYHLEVSQQTGRRHAYLEMRRRGQPRQVTPLTLPGPYAGGNGWRVETPPPLELSAPQTNGVEARVIEMHRAGASLRQIAREALGVEQPGKPTFDKIREIVTRYGGE
jgi:hypothetical protein